MDIARFVGELIVQNQQIRYDVVIPLIGLYLLILWLAISAWVGVDAGRRFQSKFWGLAWFIGVLTLNFPLLVIYFIVRPDHEWWHFASEDEVANANVNVVPIANFVDGNGTLHMSLELKVYGNNSGGHNPIQTINLSSEVPAKVENVSSNTSSSSSSTNLHYNTNNGISFTSRISNWRSKIATNASTAFHKVQVMFIPKESETKTELVKDNVKLGSSEQSSNLVANNPLHSLPVITQSLETKPNEAPQYSNFNAHKKKKRRH